MVQKSNLPSLEDQNLEEIIRHLKEREDHVEEVLRGRLRTLRGVSEDWDERIIDYFTGGLSDEEIYNWQFE